MSKQSDAFKDWIEKARQGDEEALRLVRRVCRAVFEDDAHMPLHCTLAAALYIVNLQCNFHEQN